MSPDPAPNVHFAAAKIPIEHRSHRRYAIALQVRCKRADSSEVFHGKTCDLSSGGVRFRIEKTFLPGTKLQLHIRWPFFLADGCPLQLVVSGRVIRSDRSGIVITSTRHEFRTLGMAALGRAQSGHSRDSLVT